MNNEIKVSLSIILPGRVMYSQKQAKAFEKEKSSTGYDTFSMRVEESKKNIEIINVKTRKSNPATQSLNLSVDAYNFMTGREVPSFSKTKIWLNLSTKQRLEAHLKKIVEGLGGTSFTYTIYNN